jgi:hypothetical protein
MKTTLTDLVDTLGSSLHAYVAAAGVWAFPGDEAVKLAIIDLVDDQRSLADQAGRRLEERGETPPRPVFPIQFTSTHDVDLGAMLPRVLDGLRWQISQLDRLVDAGGSPEDIDLVQQAREATLQHADVLEEIVRRGGQATPAAVS